MPLSAIKYSPQSWFGIEKAMLEVVAGICRFGAVQGPQHTHHHRNKFLHAQHQRAEDVFGLGSFARDFAYFQ